MSKYWLSHFANHNLNIKNCDNLNMSIDTFRKKKKTVIRSALLNGVLTLKSM